MLAWVGTTNDEAKSGKAAAAAGPGADEGSSKGKKQPAAAAMNLERVKTLFEKFDTDGGGSLDVEEFQAGLQAFDIYLTARQCQGLMPEVDSDKDQTVSYPEFAAKIQAVEAARAQRAARRRWLKLAKDVGVNPTYDESLAGASEAELREKVRLAEVAQLALRQKKVRPRRGGCGGCVCVCVVS